MIINGFEKLSLLDFDDKISSVIFFGGCNLRCPFCQNFDLVMMPDTCDVIPFEEVYVYLKKRKGVLDAVVITGGEPTLEKDLKEMIIKIKELGYLVKLDSNGTNPEKLKELVNEGLIDYIAMDIKNSFVSYQKTAGVALKLEKIKESINYIMSCGVDYEFRTTIIKEYHTAKDMREIGELIKGAKKYRLQKFVDHGTCLIDGLHEVPIDEAEAYKTILKEYIDNVDLRGYN